MSGMTRVSMALVLLAATAGVARAQDDPKVGLTMGYPSAIGVIWQVADRLAVRPEITLNRSTGDSSSNDTAGPQPVSSSDSTGVGAGISALWYLSRWEGLRTYVSPRFQYGRTSSSASTPGNTSTTDAITSSYFTCGSFGAQYTLGRHFGLFGEVGVGYTVANTSLTSTLTVIGPAIVNGVLIPTPISQVVHSSSHSDTIATRSGAGIIFFF